MSLPRASLFVVMIAVVALLTIAIASGSPGSATGSTATPTETPGDVMPTPVPAVTQMKIDDNRALWEATGIVNYQYDVTFSCFCYFEHGQTATVVVLDGKTSTATWSDGTTVGANDDTFTLVNGYETMDAIFDTLESTLESADKLATTFDTTDGHPIEIDVDNIAAAVDDELSVTVSNLTEIDPSSLPQTGGPP